jgi:pimeloyl-ACP methyl ester carboxylesterase
MEGAGGGRGSGIAGHLHGAAGFAAPLLIALFLASPAAGAPKLLELGSQTLALCSKTPVAYCGKLLVPLDYGSPASPKIAIAYSWYPATEVPAGAAKGTVVPVEGGPGYPSSGSVEYSSGGGQAGYRTMYGPLLGQRNLLAVDNRGTGRSKVLNCPSLQGYVGPTGTAAFQQTVAACAESLNHRWRNPDGSFLHASDLFNSVPAAEDLAAVIQALELPKIDLYGDSYGSFFAQVFAARFPRLVRSVTLDSTYESVGLDPWYRSSIASMGAAFDAACARGPACAQAAPGSSWGRIEALAASLRETPISGRVPGPGGRRETVSMNAVGLLDLVSDAAEDTQIYRDLDAAARAYLQQADPAPLLRLYAQRLAVDEAYFGQPLHEYSVGLYFADACIDYPQLFSLGVSPAQRAQELLGAEQALPGGTFAPFTIAEWLSQDENTEALTGCLDWPRPTIAQPPVASGLPLPSSLPVLVLGGEFDTWTPPVDSPKVLAEVGGNARFVELANSTHVVGEGDTVCGSAVIQEFVARPQDIQTLDSSCAPGVPAIHTVGVYPSQLGGEPPLTPAPGSSAGTEELRLAAAAVTSAGDAVARSMALEMSADAGLAGGNVTATHGGRLLTLAGDQLIPGVKVSGTVALSPAPIADDGETVVAHLSAVAPGLGRASFTATWTSSGADALARVSGTVEGRALAGTMPAP